MQGLEKKQAAIPESWSVESTEVSPYVFQVKARALDGRTMEANGTDEDRLLASVLSSISEMEERNDR